MNKTLPTVPLIEGQNDHTIWQKKFILHHIFSSSDSDNIFLFSAPSFLSFWALCSFGARGLLGIQPLKLGVTTQGHKTRR